MAHLAPRWLFFWSFLGFVLLSSLIFDFYWPAHGIYDITGDVFGRDFLNVWMASRLLATHQILDAFDLHRYMTHIRGIFGIHYPFHNWSYPPSIFPFLYPFSPLGYIPALILWTALGLLVYALATPLATGGTHRYLPYLLLLTSPAAQGNILSGQNGFFTAACFVGGFYLLKRRPYVAGILFGLLTIKPQLGLLIPVALLLMRQWRAILAAGLTTAALVGISLIFWGGEPWHLYFTTVAGYQKHLLVVSQGFYVAMMPGTFAAARIAGFDYEPAMLIHALIAIPAALLAWRIAALEGATPRSILALAIASMLATPYGYNYDLTTVAAALLAYLCARPIASTGEQFFYGLLWLLPTATFDIMFNELPIAPLVLLAALTRCALSKPSDPRSTIHDSPLTC